MKKIIITIFTTLLIMSSTFVAAQDFQPITNEDLELSDTDQSKRLFFDTIIGGDSLADLSNSPLSGLMLAFNAVILFVAGLVAAYTMLKGTLDTADRGAFFGNSANRVYFPIRVAGGAAAILPVFSGFSFIQVLVLWLAMQGAGLANYVWNSYNDTVSPGAVYLPNSQTPQLTELATQMLKNNLCININNQVSRIPEFKELTGKSNQYSWWIDNNSKEATISYGKRSNWYYKTRCGVITYKFLSGLDAASGGSNTFTSTNQLQKGVIEAVRKIQQKYIDQLFALNVKMDRLSRKIDYEAWKMNQFDIQSEINQAVDEFNSNVINTAQTSFTSSDNSEAFRNALKQDGWLFAGAYFNKFVKIQHELSNVVNHHAEQTELREIDDTDHPENVQKAFKILANATSKGYETGLSQVADQDVSHTTDDQFKGISQTFTKIIAEVNEGATKGILGLVGDEDESILITMTNLGQFMYGIAGATALLGTGSGFISGIPFVGGAGNWLIPQLTIFMWTAAGLGFAYSTILPMIPYIMWLGFIAGWAVFVLMALVGAPLWALAHMYPDADGIVGRAGQGYMLVLNLALRPVLGIMGFVLALILLNPLGVFIHESFLGAIRMTMDGSINPFAFMGAVILFFIILVMVIKIVFNIIRWVPDHVMHWLGSSLPNLADMGDTGEQAGQRAMAASRETGAKMGAVQQLRDRTKNNQNKDDGDSFAKNRMDAVKASFERQEKVDNKNKGE